MRKPMSFVNHVACLAVMLNFNSITLAGDLNPPPGPIGPTMKTLTEVEPRVPVQSLPGSGSANHVISQPGSYYLTGNITGVADKNGIDISAGGVTLDLNGFDLVGNGGERAIFISATVTNIAITNGSIRNWAKAIGGANAQSSQIHGLRIQNNGFGIQFGPQSLVTNCTARGNGGVGIRVGSGSTVIDCSSVANGSFGFELSSHTVATNCTADANGTSGEAAGILATAILAAW